MWNWVGYRGLQIGQTSWTSLNKFLCKAPSSIFQKVKYFLQKVWLPTLFFSFFFLSFLTSWLPLVTFVQKFLCQTIFFTRHSNQNGCSLGHCFKFPYTFKVNFEHLADRYFDYETSPTQGTRLMNFDWLIQSEAKSGITVACFKVHRMEKKTEKLKWSRRIKNQPSAQTRSLSTVIYIISSCIILLST